MCLLILVDRKHQNYIISASFLSSEALGFFASQNPGEAVLGIGNLRVSQGHPWGWFNGLRFGVRLRSENDVKLSRFPGKKASSQTYRNDAKFTKFRLSD